MICWNSFGTRVLGTESSGAVREWQMESVSYPILFSTLRFLFDWCLASLVKKQLGIHTNCVRCPVLCQLHFIWIHRREQLCPSIDLDALRWILVISLGETLDNISFSPFSPPQCHCIKLQQRSGSLGLFVTHIQKRNFKENNNNNN